MNLTIRELRGFRAVYELRSFSAAAQAVHLSQSAVSKLCQELESKIGNPLFDRSTRKVEPTVWADHLYGYACEILGVVDTAQRTLNGLAQLEVGEVRVAGSPMMMQGLLVGPVQRFHQQHPGVRIGLHELSTDATVAAVVDGQADFGIVSLEAPHPKLQVELLYHERMHAVCAPTHALAAQGDAPTWQVLAQHPHISLHASFSVRRTVDRVYGQLGLAYPSTIEAGTVVSVLGLVKAGLGVAVMPGYVLGFVRDLGLVGLPLPLGGTTHPISIIRRWNARSSLAANALMELLRASLRGVP